MHIKYLDKYLDKNGNVKAYVVYTDSKGKEHHSNITSEMEYSYYEGIFEAQKKNKKNDIPSHKNLRISTKLTSIIIALAIGAAHVTYKLNKNAPYSNTYDKIQTDGLFKGTKESRFIEQNEKKFDLCANALLTGNYDNVPEFSADFIKEYVSSCFAANTNDMVDGGRLNGSRYNFNFENYMSINDQVAYETKANNQGYESFIKSTMGDYTLDEIINNGNYKKYMEKYLESPLEFILQHLDPNDDEFSRLSPFTRIVISEEVKSILRLEDEGYNFFSHITPDKNVNRDELIDQINKKEQIALDNMNRQIKYKQASQMTQRRSI
jgi:hypothetical protein